MLSVKSGVRRFDGFLFEDAGTENEGKTSSPQQKNALVLMFTCFVL